MAKALFTEAATITLLVTENPKRGASADRFAHYFKAKTVGEFLALGGTRGDVIWDQQHEYIAVQDVAAKPEAAKPEAAKASKAVKSKAAKAEPEVTKTPKAKGKASKAVKEEAVTEGAWPFKPVGVGKPPVTKAVGAKASKAAKRPSKVAVTKVAA